MARSLRLSSGVLARLKNTAEVEGPLLASPPYSAVIECEPRVSAEVASVATPPLIAAVPEQRSPRP